MIGIQPRDLLQSDLVIPANLHDRSHFAKVLNEIVGKGIVVIDDEQHDKI
jgi:hypothetical protein